MEKNLKQQPASCIKVVLFGPESTGKTTLSRQLARYYNSIWVPEYAREYLQNKWNNERKICEPKDLLPIAEGQMRFENELAKKTDTVLICDTDLLETKVYSEVYYVGECDPVLEKFALENTYDLYFLTYIDTPWESDDLRDKPTEREAMFEAFKNELIKQNRPFVLLKGNKQERLQEAVKHIDKLIKNNTMLTEQNIQQIKDKGITVEQVKSQVERLKSGILHSNLIEAAVIGKGIEKFTEKEIADYIQFYENKQDSLSIIKFVPASGAATRMFKFLFQFLNSFNPEKETLNDYIERQNDDLIKTFFSDLETFPFYAQVIKQLKDTEPNFENLLQDEAYKAFVNAMLDDKALNFSFLPKGLLPFHKYEDNVVSAFREHLLESTLYASSNNIANLHFTVSEKHLDYFESEFEKVNQDLTTETGVAFNVSYSYQNQATETVALTSDNHIYKNPDGSILFRPAGHGALIENLDHLNSDVVFIKNIDNITVANKNVSISEYKKLLGGVLLNIQEQVFDYLNTLDKDCSDDDIKTILPFLINKLNVVISNDFNDFTLEDKKSYLKSKLNRPIRICGMVKNEGEPGGGPFWVKDKAGNMSLQIVEFAQIDFNKKDQQEIASNATHFSPTDLACGIKNYKGEKFNLKDYVDYDAAFITDKTQNGTDIKALELPGLWNGSMSDWISIFVEVPVETFNPVKTVNDLLKPAHQVD